MGVFSFNADFYLDAFPDVKSAVESGQFESAEQHYRLFGLFELRSPIEFFNPVFYLDSNPDVKEAYLSNLIADPLEHFRTCLLYTSDAADE